MHSAAYRFLVDRILSTRKALGLRQEDVAAALGWPRSRLSRMEKGHRRVDAIELEALAIHYGKPLKYFVPPRE